MTLNITGVSLRHLGGHINRQSGGQLRHLTIIRARSSLSNQKTYSSGAIEQKVNTASNCLTIEVRKENISRALRFFNSFIKLIRMRGHSLELTNRGTTLSVFGQQYQIKIFEQGNRVVVTEGGWTRSVIKPNGTLSLKLLHPIIKRSGGMAMLNWKSNLPG